MDREVGELKVTGYEESHDGKVWWSTSDGDWQRTFGVPHARGQYGRVVFEDGSRGPAVATGGAVRYAVVLYFRTSPGQDQLAVVLGADGSPHPVQHPIESMLFSTEFRAEIAGCQWGKTGWSYRVVEVTGTPTLADCVALATRK